MGKPGLAALEVDSTEAEIYEASCWQCRHDPTPKSLFPLCWALQPENHEYKALAATQKQKEMSRAFQAWTCFCLPSQCLLTNWTVGNKMNKRKKKGLERMIGVALLLHCVQKGLKLVSQTSIAHWKKSLWQCMLLHCSWPFLKSWITFFIWATNCDSCPLSG